MAASVDRFLISGALLTLGMLAATAPLVWSDQACNSTHPQPPGILGSGASGSGSGLTLDAASEAAFRALTGYSEQCAKCNEEAEERCPGEGVVAMGPDGVAHCQPAHVPKGFPPSWSCTFTVGADGGAWQYECSDC